MSIDGARAFQVATGLTGLPRNSCWFAVWKAVAAAGAQPSRDYPSATAAMNASPGMHYGDYNPPVGRPVWFGVRNDGSVTGPDGDVGLSDGHGNVCAIWGTSMRTTTIAQRARDVGRPYVGWTDLLLTNTYTADPIVRADPFKIAKESETSMYVRLDPAQYPADQAKVVYEVWRNPATGKREFYLVASKNDAAAAVNLAVPCDAQTLYALGQDLGYRFGTTDPAVLTARAA